MNTFSKMDDGMMDELMIPNSEPLGELNDYNKSSNVFKDA
jgi:hypothetical protein